MIGYTKAVSKRGKREKARNNKRLVHIFVQIALPREISMTRVDVRCSSTRKWQAKWNRRNNGGFLLALITIFRNRIAQ